MSAVFVIVTSDTCGHCITFKKEHFINLLNKLNLITNLNILLINRDTSGEYKTQFLKPENENSTSINTSIYQSIAWFPMFMLIPKDIIFSKNMKQIVGYVMNGNLIDGKAKLNENGTIPATSDNIYSWVEKHLNDKMFQSKSISYSNPSTVKDIIKSSFDLKPWH